MKVAISTDSGLVSAHFGRCSSYTIFDIEEGKITSKEEIPNPGHQPGFLPEYLSERGVNCIIAGGMGPRAQGLFAHKNITTIIGIQGPIDEVMQKFISNELEEGEDLCGHRSEGEHHPCAHNHSQLNHSSPGTKICVTSQGPGLEVDIDPRFGRARYFLIIDLETLEFEAIENPNVDTPHGAGIQSAQLISGKNIGTVLTGNCGPNAQRVFQSTGIKVVTGQSGKVRDALSKYKSEVK